MTLFGNRLKFLRIRSNLTQEQLSQIINVSTSAIGMYERGAREPAFATLFRIADYFKVSIDYLVGYSSKIEGKHSDRSIHLSNSDEKILQLKLDHPELFDELLKIEQKDIEKLTKLIKLIQED